MKLPNILDYSFPRGIHEFKDFSVGETNGYKQKIRIVRSDRLPTPEVGDFILLNAAPRGGSDEQDIRIAIVKKIFTSTQIFFSTIYELEISYKNGRYKFYKLWPEFEMPVHEKNSWEI